MPPSASSAPVADPTDPTDPADAGVRDGGVLVPERQSAAPTTPDEPSHPRRLVGRGVAAAFAGTCVAVAVAAAVTSGAVPGPVLLAAALGVALAVPTSRLLARRILWHGALLAGVVPTLWWVDLPLGRLGRFGLLLALASGALAAWTLADGRAGLRDRARRLLPAWQVVDLLPLGAVAAGAWYLLPWLRVGSATDALAALVPGWDHSAHFAMTHALRLSGATADVAGAPIGGASAFAGYPEGHHTLVATLMEALAGTSATDVRADLVAYLHASCLVLLGVLAMVAAGLCALPRLRRRPAVATPLAALAVAALVVGPGGIGYAQGFVNFVPAVALTACVPLVVATMPRVTLPVPLAAVGALVVAVAHGWVLLLVMALPMAAVVLLPLRRARWRADRRTWVLCGAIAAATLLGLLAAVRVVLRQDVSHLLVTPGGIIGPEMGALALVVAGALGGALWSTTRSAPRLAWAAVGPAVGLLTAGGLALAQLSSTGGVSYYFWKLLIGVELVSAVVLGGTVSRWVTAARPGLSRVARLRVAAASLGIAAGASQVFGVAVTGQEIFPVDHGRTAQAVELLRAADAATAVGGPTVSLAPAGTGALEPLNAQQWHLALTGAWSARAHAAAGTDIVTEQGTARGWVEAARLALRDPEVHVVVPPESAAELRAELPTSMAARVVSW